MRTPLPSLRRLAGALALTAVAAATASAQVAWTDWTSAGTNTASGTLSFGGQMVGVTYTGPYTFVQTGAGNETNYWLPNVYTGAGVPNAPTTTDIVALSTGGTKTITFSTPVVNPLLALVSWNGQANVTFGGPIQLVATGGSGNCGFWGCGSFVVNGNALTANGEAHGTIRLVGTYSSITFVDVTENWHGFTVGAEAVATTNVIPEPSTYALMATGLVGTLVAARRRRNRA
jgi:hypothetical protein